MKLYEFLHVISDVEELFNYLCDHNVIRRTIICPQCDERLFVRKENSKYIFRCTKSYICVRRRKRQKVKCNFAMSAFNGTWFSQSRLDLQKICRFIAYFLFIQPPRYSFLQSELNMSSNSIVDWTNFCRELLGNWLENNDQQFGGPDIIVEMDEAKIGKRKYKKGRIIEGQWVLGGYERGSGKVFVLPVPNRSAQTLQEIICRKIRPNTIIYTDCWRGYSALNTLNFHHCTVNHKQHFVDPTTGAHTQNIERLWRDMRSAIPRYGLNHNNFTCYLAEFLFKRLYPFSERLETFFKIMSEIYLLNETIEQ